MCGIAGYVSLDRAVVDGVVERMTARLHHRGPDAFGYYRDDVAQLGHRRLSIIDLSTGQQPMTSESGELWVIYNGEIFNHAELRPPLEAAGHRYHSRSDTETILHSYEQYGAGAPTRFRGMFAFAIWDERTSSLFAARDHFGVKPFYYHAFPDGRLLFGGGENYRPGFPADLAEFVRRHMLRVYPQLADVAITHAWGGTLGVTPHRVPYVRQVAEGVRIAAGYSGQGVMLAPHVGRLLAKAALGDTQGVDLLSRLPVPPFPGGRLLRWPLTVAGLSWYALKDRL